MIEQNVQVVRCQDERLWVQVGSQTGCTACEDGRGCGAGVFSRLLRRKPLVLELPRNGLDIDAGQMMTLAIPERVYLSLVFGSYGWPLLAALAGASVGYAVVEGLQLPPALLDAGTLLTGLACGALALRLNASRLWPRRLENDLQSVVYYPAANPNMCSRKGPQMTAEGGK
jgi:sigma-E factor negative regulatory protein RseC